MILEAANKYYSQLHSDLHAIKHYVQNNPGAFITILYLLGSVSGVIYLATLLNKFSVDVFHHIELTDFLLALLSNPMLVVLYTTYLALVTLLLKRQLNRIPDPKKPTLWQKIYHGFTYPLLLINPTISLIMVLFFMLCFYSFIIADSHSEKIFSKKTQTYSISLNDAIQSNKTNLLREVQIVTSTSKNLFIYDNKQEKLIIIPQHNIGAATPTFKKNEVTKQ